MEPKKESLLQSRDQGKCPECGKSFQWPSDKGFASCATCQEVASSESFR